MPRKPRLDRDAVWARIRRVLTQRGPVPAAELARAAGVSQSSFSRLAAEHRDELLVVGGGRSTRYALLRAAADVGTSLPIYEVEHDGRTRELAVVHLVFPQGFFIEASIDGLASRSTADPPYFLHDLRPSGFLGRLVPKQHPELMLPPDVRNWNAEQTLRYLSRFGWDLTGNLVVGDAALALYNHRSLNPPGGVDSKARRARYPELAEDALGSSAPGSSAGGEQPKFLALRMPESMPVLVKFSPPLDSAASRRHADLLVAEHVAHETLRRVGHSAASSELLSAGDRIFLEVARFDRTSGGGRLGLLSFEALDAEFVGKAISWSNTADALVELALLTESDAAEARFREQFGHWIGNTDMHGANLSVFTSGLQVTGLAPVYDMVPMHYAPRQGNLVAAPLRFARPHPSAADEWAEAGSAALSFWRELAAHPLLSDDFRGIAEDNVAAIGRLL